MARMSSRKKSVESHTKALVASAFAAFEIYGEFWGDETEEFPGAIDALGEAVNEIAATLAKVSVRFGKCTEEQAAKALESVPAEFKAEADALDKPSEEVCSIN